MTQTEELGPLGSAVVAAIVVAYLVDTPSVLSSTPTVRWVLMLGMASIAILGVVTGLRDL